MNIYNKTRGMYLVIRTQGRKQCFTMSLQNRPQSHFMSINDKTIIFSQCQHNLTSQCHYLTWYNFHNITTINNTILFHNVTTINSTILLHNVIATNNAILLYNVAATNNTILPHNITTINNAILLHQKFI